MYYTTGCGRDWIYKVETRMSRLVFSVVLVWVRYAEEQLKCQRLKQNAR